MGQTTAPLERIDVRGHGAPPVHRLQLRRLALPGRAQRLVRNYEPGGLHLSVTQQSGIGDGPVARRRRAHRDKGDAIAPVKPGDRYRLSVKAAVFERSLEAPLDAAVRIISDAQDGAELISPIADPSHIGSHVGSPTLVHLARRAAGATDAAPWLRPSSGRQRPRVPGRRSLPMRKPGRVGSRLAPSAQRPLPVGDAP